MASKYKYPSTKPCQEVVQHTSQALLLEYVMQFHHLERHCHHRFGSKVERVENFIWSLGEGLRTKVMGTRLDTLVDVVGMTIRFKEDFAYN